MNVATEPLPYRTEASPRCSDTPRDGEDARAATVWDLLAVAQRAVIADFFVMWTRRVVGRVVFSVA